MISVVCFSGYGPVVCDILQSYQQIPMSWRNLLPPSSASKCCLILNRETVHFSKTLV
jgi:hypothetical protein